ncbi:Lrp/AsnC family transcriptional regulator [[Micrococcus luteus] ATCC 49442]|uniref:Lrp/AsnC family transcriptional regulator n=1 Tax=[Micrococcus luteus] ATCC 49442 TaxID=2698727 RepID=UPI0013DC5544|nr:Lrp/AsnC family transcriptional regulator [[Micrococcus luteus] ATCC 49442]
MSEGPLQGLSARFGEASEPVDVDAIDLQLLRALAQDSRASLKSLSQTVGLSSPSVSERISRLTSTGIIRKFSVDIDWSRLGYTLSSYITISVKSGYDRDLVFGQLLKLPSIESVSIVTGGRDFLVRMRTAGFDDLRKVLAQELWTLEGVDNTETQMAIYFQEIDDVAERRLAEITNHQNRAPVPLKAGGRGD